jgi:glycosyltransferase 2 family protein
LARKGRILGFLLTAIFLWIVARNVNGAELMAAFRGADYRLVAPAAMATIGGYLLRTFRWQRIVRPVAPLHFGGAFAILMMGFAANNLLPARLGEVVRAYLLRRQTGARKTYGVATIILERICDGLTLILFLGFVSLLMPLPDWGQEVQAFSSLLFLGAAVAIVVLLMKESLVVRLADLVLGRFPDRVAGPMLRAIGVFISGLHSLKSKRSLVAVIALSIAVWLLEASSYFLMTSAFNVSMKPLSLILASLFLLVVVNLGIMLPSAPGYVGTFQFFAVMALGAFGVPKETALAVAISSHLMQYLIVTAVGLFFFVRQNVGLWNVERQASADSDDEATAIAAGVE